MSHYAEYIKEREGKETIETDVGFCTYQFVNDTVYIETIFVRKDFRKSNVAKEMADKVADIARERGYFKLLGSVCPKAKGATDSVKVLLAYGFNILSIDGGLIWFTKELV